MIRNALQVLMLLVIVAAATSCGEPPPATPAPQATPVERLKVKEGFKVELLYSVPNTEQGSWVAMCLDPQGRIIVSDQYGSLYRVSVPPLGQTQPFNIEKLKADISGAHGVLYAFDSLYVIVDEGKMKHGLYRLQDTDKDDQFDKVELLREIQGGGEHGPHQVLLSPDGKSLVVMCGNHTKLVDCDTSVVPRVWQEDHILTRMWDSNGHAKGILAPGGYVCRVSPDGQKWELISMGYRNQYDAAFNANGDLFTYDSDMEWDMNTPWYRPTRVCFATDGSEFGWRSGSGVWPPYYPDSLPATQNVGPGSPTGVTFGYGAKFPKKYQEALFLCDWSYGKLYCAHLTPKGAAYDSELELFISGTPLPLTDILVRPQDGALYFAIGGRKVQSGFYRVTYTGSEAAAPLKPEANLTPEMTLRRSLEAFYNKKNPAAVKAAWPNLAHKDRFIRFAARTALEFQDAATWQDQALAETNPQAALTALLGLVRIGSKDLQPRVLGALKKIDWNGLDHAQRLELLRVYQLTFLRLGAPDAAVAQKVAARFDPLYPAPQREMNAELAQLLIYLEAPSAASKTMALMSKATSQEEQLEYAKSLRVLKSGWTPELRKQYFTWFVNAQNYRGGNSFKGFVNNIKDEAVTLLDAATKAELKPILESKATEQPVLETMRKLLAGRAVVKEWVVADLLPAAEKNLKGGRNFERGQKMFSAAACVVCHRFDNEGGAMGPDLTGLAGRYSQHDLIEAIIEPSKAVSDQYVPVLITLKDKKKVIGRVVNLHGDTLHVNTDMFNPNMLAGVKQSDVVSIEPYKHSPMPEGLLNVLNEDEIMDLLAYLLSRGDPKSEMFKK